MKFYKHKNLEWKTTKAPEYYLGNCPDNTPYYLAKFNDLWYIVAETGEYELLTHNVHVFDEAVKGGTYIEIPAPKSLQHLTIK